METTLIHLTDFRLPQGDSRSWRYWLSLRTIKYFFWKKLSSSPKPKDVLTAIMDDMQKQYPDVVLASGDITKITSKETFDGSASWLHAACHPAPTLLAPGDQQTYKRIAWSAMRRSDPTRLFSQSKSGEGASMNARASEFPYTLCVSEQPRIEVIVLNTAPFVRTFLSRGHLGRKQLSKLKRELIASRARGAYRVILLHDSPVDGLGIMDRLSFWQIIRSVGAELILCRQSRKTPQSHFAGSVCTTVIVNGNNVPSLFEQNTQSPGRYLVIRINKIRPGEFATKIYARQYDPEQLCIEPKERLCFKSVMQLPDALNAATAGAPEYKEPVMRCA